MTDRFGPLYDWIKIALGGVFVLGYLLMPEYSESLMSKTTFLPVKNYIQKTAPS